MKKTLALTGTILAIATNTVIAETPMPNRQEPPGFDIVDELIQLYMLTTGPNVSRLFVPGNDQLTPGPTNTFVGFRSLVGCPNVSGNYVNSLPGGFGVCVPDVEYPGFGAGLVYEPNHTPEDCQILTNIAAVAIQNKVIPGTENGVDETTISGLQTNNPNSGVPFGLSGGVCSPTSSATYSLVGWFMGHVTLVANAFSKVQCALLVNMCWGAGPCSCDGYYHSGS